MTDAELRDELVTLLLAGHETTAIGLAWALERLRTTPRCRSGSPRDRERRRPLPGGDDQGDAAQPHGRVRHRALSEGPFTVGGHRLPEGVHVVPALALVHRWEPLSRAARFRPERFLEGQDESYSWIPFGGGVRRCIGATFASFEMKVVLRALVARIAVEPARSQPEKAKFRNVTLVPARGAELILRDRPTATTDRDGRHSRAHPPAASVI